jgi:predicted NAD/FAD-dependent oxidoreductase
VTTIAVVGAGLPGLVAARQLQAFADVTVFEKSRGAGGRMATRYAGEFKFDHGAQFFTARTTAFRDFLEPLLSEGVIADWPARFAELDSFAQLPVVAARHDSFLQRCKNAVAFLRPSLDYAIAEVPLSQSSFARKIEHLSGDC